MSISRTRKTVITIIIITAVLVSVSIRVWRIPTFSLRKVEYSLCRK